ncbi:MAG TPA: hypothetical protein P5056_01575, partial [Candidatus Paceibacterota bacterium]|nr:hypothetical protein [Candidatus Paceibacterota bacterium]
MNHVFNKNRAKRYLTGGAILVQLLVLAGLSSILISSLVAWSASSLRSSRREFNRELSFQIAEAGIEYYRWHLTSTSTDYTDGTTLSGPYIHDFKDKNGNTIGSFSLQITPPLIGSTRVKITSTGTLSSDPDSARTIEVEVAKPSLGKFSVITESDIRFGEGTEVFGP